MAEASGKELTILEQLIIKLQVAYEQFFTGGTKTEPLDLVKQAEDIIRNCSRGQIKNPAVRFRFNGLMARYNSYRSVWDRRKRRFEGEATPRAYSLKPSREEDVFTVIISETQLTDKQTNAVFTHYLEMRRKCGEPVDKLRAENFKAILSENIAKIRQRTGCSSVMVRVDIHDNKSRILAKPFEE